MNRELQDYARQNIKDGLAICTEKEQQFFKRMYSNGNMDLPINEVVDQMPTEKLDWAMQQIQRTLDKKSAA